MKHLPARRSRAVAFSSAAALAAIFAVPGVASADVSTTTVNAPAADSVFDLELDDLSGGIGGIDPVAVTGVAPGAADGDTVWLGCSLTVNGLGVFVPLGGGGPVTIEDQKFSGEIIPPPVTCRVRAVPIDEEESTLAFLKTEQQLAPYAGPRALGGAYLKQSTPIYTDEGEESGESDFYINARGQGRGFAATTSAASPAGLGGLGYGLFGGLLAAAPIDDTSWRLLLGPSGGLSGFGGFEGEDPSNLANYGLIVDGAPAVVYPMDFTGGAKVVSRTVDPATGDTKIVETAPVVKAVFTGDDYPEPGESGIAIERTTTQDKEGRQVTFSDVFRSTDGAAHRIEARYNGSAISAFFGAGGTIPELPEGELPEEIGEVLESVQTEPASFRLPWATGEEYVTPAADTTYGAAPAGRTTIWVHGPRLDLGKLTELIPPTEEEPTETTLSRPSSPSAPAAARADGAEVPRGEGAITFDDAPSDVKFLTPGSFVARFVRDIPAGGTASVKHTYSQDLTPESLKELVDGPTVVPPVEDPKPPIKGDTPLPTQPAPVPAIPSIPGLPTPVNPLPKLAKSTGKVLITKAQGRRLRDRKPVTVTTKGMPAGRYGITIRRWVINGKTIANGVKTIKKDGDLKIGLKLTKYGRWYLGLKKTRARKSVKVRVIVTWTPPGKGRQKQETSYVTNFR